MHDREIEHVNKNGPQVRSMRAYRCSRALYFVCACLLVILANLGAVATENSLESVSQIILPVFVFTFCKFLDRFNLSLYPLFIARIQICEEEGFFVLHNSGNSSPDDFRLVRSMDLVLPQNISSTANCVQTSPIFLIANYVFRVA